MRTTTFGRTGLTVSVAGLGCGGHSKLGTTYGNNHEQAASIVRLAVENGVNYIDTAPAYGTESVVAKALKDLNRDELVLSTKGGLWNYKRHWSRAFRTTERPPLSAKALIGKLEQSLSTLGVETIDVYHLHGLYVAHLDHALNTIVPAMQDAQRAGKIRHLAVSEAFSGDPGHTMLTRLLREAPEAFDVVMVGHNLVNFSARQRVLDATRTHDIAVEMMFAVRRALARPDAIRALVADLIEQGTVDPASVDLDNPLGFLADFGIDSVTEAAYRFCAHEPGGHVVLFGTGNPDHLIQNIAAINGDPLPQEALDQLSQIFGQVDSVSGD